jgi:undecaprenyl-diphosphatase
MDFLNSLLPTIEHFRILGYWIVLFISLLESLAFIGIAIPGTIFIVLIGFVSAKGFLDLGDLIWFAAIGAIMGDVLSYYLGSHVKKFFKDDSRIFKSKYLNRGKHFFGKYGGRSIFLGRFVGPIRPIIPFVAGMLNMDRKKFLSWNIFSGFVWATTFLLIGFFFGQAWETIALWSTRGSMFMVTFVGFIFVFYILKWLVVKNGKQIVSFLLSVWHSIKQAIVNNSDVQKLVKKHILFFKFIKGRLDKSRFWGLPATLLFFGFIYTFFLFVGIIEDVITADLIVSVDIRITNLLAVFRNVDITQFFLWITLLGKWQVVLGFAVAIIGVLWIWRKRLYIAPLVLTIAGSEIFTALGKIAFHRSRPELAIYTEHSFSFPSGHATIAVAFYGFLTYILIRSFGRWKTKVNVFFVGLAVILLIGFGRLYLGVHYVSDVWGGYLVGALWLIIGISISEWIHSWKTKDIVFSPSVKMRSISAILILLSFLSYILIAINYHPQTSQPIILQEEVIVQDINDIFSDEKLKYTETLTGEKQEPISFIILSENNEKLTKLFKNSGWFLADTVNISSVAKLAEMAFLKQSYPQAPMTPSFWNSKVHSFGFEKPTKTDNVRERHHARFWKTNYIMANGNKIYVGTASLDSGIKWGFTHKINPNIDTEREFLFNNMENTDVLIDFKKQKFVEPVLGQNFSGDPFFTDGQVYIISVD